MGLVLDSKLSLNDDDNQKINKCSKIIELMKRLPLMLSRSHLLTIYQTCVRSHLDYAHKLHDKLFNDSFKAKLEKGQYSAALIITGALKDTYWKRLHKELGLESLCHKRWYCK